MPTALHHAAHLRSIRPLQWYAALTLVLASACGGSDGSVVAPPSPDAISALTVSPSAPTLVAGTTVALTPTPTTAGTGVSVQYAYASGATAVATVSATGVVTAVSAGTATITLTATGSGNGFTTNSRQATVGVTVTAQPPALTGLTVSPSAPTLVAGATTDLSPTPATAGAAVSVEYAYATSAAAVATVSTTGVITAVSAGTATITVTATGSGNGFATNSLQATAAVTVTAPPPPPLGVGFGAEQFANIPAGSFQMGSTTGLSNEAPVRTVTLSTSFLMQRTEVTQGQWRQVMQGTGMENPSAFPTCGETCPVDTVSWDDIQIFLQRLNQQDPGKGYRLPSEAEWEYAARAGTTGDYGGNGVLSDMGWWSGNAGGTPHPVAQKLANAFGIYDMHGNMAEWVNDRYDATYYSTGPNLDPPGPAAGSTRVIRGGDWASGAQFSRSTGRSNFAPSAKGDLGGFRLVRNP